MFRGAAGRILERSSLAEAIASDPDLAGRILVAEPWDATGFTPAAGFPEPWLEWDGEFRDGLRAFVGAPDRGDAARFPRRMAATGPHAGELPARRAVRFAACHDGRPLADIPVYAVKHNRANGEDNRDGWDGEVAWNGGQEGPSEDAALAGRRAREVRMLLALLGAAPGTPLLAAGDEMGRTQGGNTNAWCQDNEVGWVVWPADLPAIHRVHPIAAAPARGAGRDLLRPGGAPRTLRSRRGRGGGRHSPPLPGSARGRGRLLAGRRERGREGVPVPAAQAARVEPLAAPARHRARPRRRDPRSRAGPLPGRRDHRARGRPGLRPHPRRRALNPIGRVPRVNAAAAQDRDLRRRERQGSLHASGRTTSAAVEVVPFNTRLLRAPAWTERSPPSAERSRRGGR